MDTIRPAPLPRKEFIGNMKRAAIFLLVFSLLAGLMTTAEAASSYTLPDALKAVPGTMEGLFEPGELPPYVEQTLHCACSSRGNCRRMSKSTVSRSMRTERSVSSSVKQFRV